MNAEITATRNHLYSGVLPVCFRAIGSQGRPTRAIDSIELSVTPFVSAASSGTRYYAITGPLEYVFLPFLHDLHPARWPISNAEALDAFIEWIMGFAQVDYQNLILPMMDRAAEYTAQRGQFHPVELAKKHTVLGMVAVVSQRLEHLIPPLVVGDVVRNEEVPS